MHIKLTQSTLSRVDQLFFVTGVFFLLAFARVHAFHRQITGASSHATTSSSLSSSDLPSAMTSNYAEKVSARRMFVPKLPEKLIVGYANWNECDDKIVEAVQAGVNVVIWFSINLAIDPETQAPTITNGPDMDCVAEKVKKIRELGLETVHLISIGGWNSPHPDTTNSAEVTYENWNNWNRIVVARPEKGFFGFDGFDWDVEGNDDFDSPYNEFTCACLDLMGRFSQIAKERGGYIVSMAPAESYVDPTVGSAFDRDLRHEYAEWRDIVPGFRYHGLNTYTYLLARYGKYQYQNNGIASGGNTEKERTGQGKSVILAGVGGGEGEREREKKEVLQQEKEKEGEEEEEERDTFDFVTIQLYEGYSHAEYNTTVYATTAATPTAAHAAAVSESAPRGGGSSAADTVAAMASNQGDVQIMQKMGENEEPRVFSAVVPPKTTTKPAKTTTATITTVTTTKTISSVPNLHSAPLRDSPEEAADYLVRYVQLISRGWDVDFATDVELNYPKRVKIEIPAKTKLVIGLANGWAGDGKFFLIYPDQVERAYKLLAEKFDLAPRGFAFWNILDEGAKSPQRPYEPVFMAAGLNRFLKIRE